MRKNEELCLLAKNGDAQAMNELIENNIGLVRKIAWKLYANSRQSYHLTCVDFDDMQQEGLLAMTKAMANYAPENGATFTTYAGTAVHNAICDWLEHRKYLLSKETELSEMLPCDIVWQDNPNIYKSTPERIVLKKEELESIKRSAADLPDRYRVCLKYRFGLDDGKAHSITETAEHFGISLAKVKQLEKVILKEIQQILR